MSTHAGLDYLGNVPFAHGCKGSRPKAIAALLWFNEWLDFEVDVPEAEKVVSGEW